MPISAQYLAYMRKRALEELPDRCVIERYITLANDMGESIKSWATLALDIPCSVATVQSVAARERERLGSIGQLTPWLIALPHNQEVTSRDRIRVTTQDPDQTYTVMAVTGPHSNEIRRVAMVDLVS